MDHPDGEMRHSDDPADTGPSCGELEATYREALTKAAACQQTTDCAARVPPDLICRGGCQPAVNPEATSFAALMEAKRMFDAKECPIAPCDPAACAPTSVACREGRCVDIPAAP